MVWIAGIVLQLAICGLMLRNGKQKYPCFFAYCLFGATQNLLLLVLHALGTYQQYFYAFWSTGAVSAYFALSVIREIFLVALEPFAGLRDLGRIAFRWATALMILIALAVGLNIKANYISVIQTAVLNFESSVRMMQVGLLLMMFFFSKRIGLSIRSRTFGIALGVGTTAAINLFSVSLLSGVGTAHLVLVNQFRAGFFLVAAVTWCTYFAVPAPQEKFVMVPIASPLMRWNEVAAALGHPAGRVVYANGTEPFLPQAERMVDEIWEQNFGHGNVRSTS